MAASLSGIKGIKNKRKKMTFKEMYKLQKIMCGERYRGKNENEKKTRMNIEINTCTNKNNKYIDHLIDE